MRIQHADERGLNSVYVNDPRADWTAVPTSSPFASSRSFGEFLLLLAAPTFTVFICCFGITFTLSNQRCDLFFGHLIYVSLWPFLLLCSFSYPDVLFLLSSLLLFKALLVSRARRLNLATWETDLVSEVVRFPVWRFNGDHLLHCRCVPSYFMHH